MFVYLPSKFLIYESNFEIFQKLETYIDTKSAQKEMLESFWYYFLKGLKNSLKNVDKCFLQIYDT